MAEVVVGGMRQSDSTGAEARWRIVDDGTADDERSLRSVRRFEVTFERGAGWLSVAVAGPVNGEASTKLLSLLRDEWEGEARIELDLRQVSEIDEQGCVGLVRFRDRAMWLGALVTVEKASAAVVSSLGRLGLSDSFGLLS